MVDRPIQCSGCKKKISCHYTIIDLEQTSTMNMCADCPVLENCLHGDKSSTCEVGEGASSAGRCCVQCGTTLESVRLGTPLGCPECYDIFSDILLLGMQSSSTPIPPLHAGRAPGKSMQTNPALRLHALNEALSECLNREDYEQAAWLRDQIKLLSKKEMDK